jgi:hypothetical protein
MAVVLQHFIYIAAIPLPTTMAGVAYLNSEVVYCRAANLNVILTDRSSVDVYLFIDSTMVQSTE